MEGRGLDLMRVMEAVLVCRDMLAGLDVRMGKVEGLARNVEGMAERVHRMEGFLQELVGIRGGQAPCEPPRTCLVKEELRAEENTLVQQEAHERDGYQEQSDGYLVEEYSNTSGYTGGDANSFDVSRSDVFHPEVVDIADEESSDLDGLQDISSDVRPSLPKTTMVYAKEEDEYFETQEDWKDGIMDAADENGEDNYLEDLPSGGEGTLQKDEQPVQKDKSAEVPMQHKVCSKTFYSQGEWNACVKSHEDASDESKEKANDPRGETSGGGNSVQRRVRELRVEKMQSGIEAVEDGERNKVMKKTSTLEGDVYQSRDKHDMTRHLTVRAGEKPYTCIHCGRKYSHQPNLSAHIQSFHLGNNPHECKFCPRKFYDACKLTQHVNAVHLKLKLYSCDVCGAKFARSYGAHRHKRKFH